MYQWQVYFCLYIYFMQSSIYNHSKKKFIYNVDSSICR